MRKITLILFLILILGGCSDKNQTYMGKIPFGVQFGSSYEQILSYDGDAEDPVLNKNGDQMISAHRDIDGSFLGYSKDDLSITLMYAFGMNDSLNFIGEHITINSDSSVSAADLFTKLCDSFSEQYGKPDSNTYALYSWHTSDGIDITVTMFNDLLISVNFELN